MFSMALCRFLLYGLNIILHQRALSYIRVHMPEALQPAGDNGSLIPRTSVSAAHRNNLEYEQLRQRTARLCSRQNYLDCVGRAG